MLDVNMEFRKGILFVRIGGILNNHTRGYLDSKLKKMVVEQKVRYVVFNIIELNSIDLDGINILMKYNQLLSENNGQALVCGINDNLVKYQIENSKILQNMFITNDELSAINMIKM